MHKTLARRRAGDAEHLLFDEKHYSMQISLGFQRNADWLTCIRPQLLLPLFGDTARSLPRKKVTGEEQPGPR